MRLTKMSCDGCGRHPSFGEWFKGEITMAGYPEWRHPGIAFKEAGIPLTFETRAVWTRAWQALFQRPVPDEMAFLCPECQTNVDLRLPDMLPEIHAQAEREKVQEEQVAAQRKDQERSYFGQ